MTELVQEVGLQNSWGKVIETAYHHAVVPQFYKACKSLSPLVPKEHLLFLQQAYQQIAQENMRLSAELISLSKELDKRHIQYIALKGPTLAQELYNDITLRQICDLDLLIDEVNISDVAKLLIESGFESRLPLSLLENKGFLALDNDFTFLHHTKKTMVELHWKLFPKRHNMPLDFKTLYRASDQILIQNKTITVLSQEHNLLYLCLHGSKHIFEELKWLSDIDRLIRINPAIDLEKVYENAKELDVTEPLMLGLLMSQCLYSTPLPDSIVDRAKPTTEFLLRTALDFFVQDFNTLNEPVKKRERFLFLNSLNQNKQNRIIALIKSAFTPSSVDYIHYNLPSRYNFLYPLLRPPRLFYKYLLKKILA